MDSFIFALGIFVGGMISCVLVLSVGVAGTLQGFAFLGMGVAIILTLKFVHGMHRNLTNARRLEKMSKAAEEPLAPRAPRVYPSRAVVKRAKVA